MQRTARSGQSCLLLAADRTPTALFGTVHETVGLATRGFTIAGRFAAFSHPLTRTTGREQLR